MWTIYDGDSQHRHPQTRQRQAPHQQHPSIHIRVRIPVRNTTKLHADTTPGSPEFRQFLAAMLRFGRVEQRENTFRGRHAVHRNVEIRAELSQRNEEIGG